MQTQENIKTIKIKPIHDQGDRPDIIIKPSEYKFADIFGAMNKDAIDNEYELENIKSYITLRFCHEYMKICAAAETETKGPEIKTLTDDKIESFLKKEEIMLIKSIETACESRAAYLRVLSYILSDANYLGMEHLVRKVCGVTAITFLGLPRLRDISESDISNANLPYDFVPVVIESKIINLISTVPGLSDKINRTCIIDMTPVKSLDDSDTEQEQEEKQKSDSSDDDSEASQKGGSKSKSKAKSKSKSKAKAKAKSKDKHKKKPKKKDSSSASDDGGESD